MYNFRILIQEIQLLRGSFRIYVLIARGSACLGTSTKTSRSGWWGTLAHVQFLASLWAGVAVSSQGRTLFKPHVTFLYQASFPSKNLLCWGTLKRIRKNSGRMVITSWLREVRLWKMAGLITPTARGKFREKNGNSERHS